MWKFKWMEIMGNWYLATTSYSNICPGENGWQVITSTEMPWSAKTYGDLQHHRGPWWPSQMPFLISNWLPTFFGSQKRCQLMKNIDVNWCQYNINVNRFIAVVLMCSPKVHSYGLTSKHWAPWHGSGFLSIALALPHRALESPFLNEKWDCHWNLWELQLAQFRGFRIDEVSLNMVITCTL